MIHEELEDAFHLVKDNPSDYEDALHLANAMRSGADRILTDDEGFNQTPLKTMF